MWNHTGSLQVLFRSYVFVLYFVFGVLVYQYWDSVFFRVWNFQVSLFVVEKKRGANWHIAFIVLACLGIPTINISMTFIYNQFHYFDDCYLKAYLRLVRPSTIVRRLQDRLRCFRLVRYFSPSILQIWLDDKSRCVNAVKQLRFSILKIKQQHKKIININPMKYKKTYKK